MSTANPSDKLEISLSTVTELIAQQFPQWAHMQIKPVAVSGWDNRTFRLGMEMLMRLPSAQCYAAKVAIEQKWLPILAPHISLHIPKPIALGNPSKDYPFNWSIYQWIEGQSANNVVINDSCLTQIGLQLAQFINELHKIDPTDGPLSGEHNFYRGGSLLVYDSETNSALKQLKEVIDTDAVLSVWKKSISSQWNNDPVWIHGDVSAGNILLKDNQLVAVIDFGGMGIGDPACDLVIAWTFFKSESREAFKSNVHLDSDTWARARGWALWKALITLAPLKDQASVEALKQKQIIEEVISEHYRENN